MAPSGDRTEVADRLAARVKDAGFTPGLRDLSGLLELVAAEDEDLADAAERAILRIEKQYAARVAEGAIASARAATRPARGRLTRLVGRLAARDGKDEARAWLIDALGDADEKTRRNAARALGKLPPAPELEEALLRAWDAAASDADKRAIGEALGKIGGEQAKARVRDAAQDPALARAAILLDRRDSREAPGVIDVAAAQDCDVEIRFFCRDGLEAIVAEELGAEWRPHTRRGIVDATLRGPLSRALAVRTATHAGFPLTPVPASEDLAADIVRVVASAPALALLRAYTCTDGDAPIRFRVHFVRGGHRRAIVWRCAELTRQANCGLVNDPTASTWEVVVDDTDGHVAIVLVPRGFEDTRFAYRTSTVSASSHPTIAAAIARAAPRSERDAVWDPFMGAGAELVERALLGPYASLLGTDIDPKALEAARQNLERAGVRGARLERADSTNFEPRGGITLILSNPPMGRRVARGEHHDLLARFAERAARILKPGGALVWTVPEPKAIHPRAEASGLVLERGWPVDIGGFTAELSVYRKRSR